MSQTQIYTGALAMVLAAIGMWLMLPRGNQPGRWLGVLSGIASLVLFGALGARMGSEAREVAFAILAGVTIFAAAATVVFRSPLYCALWFALSLLGTAGLFMLQGAQFLGVATVVVYAGAILVTFLFVLMLAQPEGHAYYDRVSWEGMFAATAGAVIVGFLTMTIVRVLNPHVDPELMAAVESFEGEGNVRIEAEDVRRGLLTAHDDGTWTAQIDLNEDAPGLKREDYERLSAHLLDRLPALQENQVSQSDFELTVARVHDSVFSAETADRTVGILADEHVATLGAHLFGQDLIAIEVAGTALLVALVAAIAIVNHDRASLGRPLRDSAGGSARRR